MVFTRRKKNYNINLIKLFITVINNNNNNNKKNSNYDILNKLTIQSLLKHYIYIEQNNNLKIKI